jgi:hypothetical protein
LTSASPRPWLARSRPRRASLALATLLLLPAATPVAAQDDDIAFPETIAGLEVQVDTYTGPEYLELLSGDDAENRTFTEGTQALVEGVGATIDDLTVRTGLYDPPDGQPAVVAAFRIDGADARDFVRDAVGVVLGDVTVPDLLLRPIADRWVLRVVDAAMPGVYPRTLLLDDDTVWIMEGDEIYVREALLSLPEQPGLSSRVESEMADQIPYVLDGRRRTGLYESTEPLFLPTLSDRLNADVAAIERWLVDLYLEGGITPAEMVGLVTWWGIESSQDSVQVEGYQLAGADPALVQRLLDEIILAESGLPAGATRVDEEIGGRQVATVEVPPSELEPDLPTLRQHIFTSGDTVWVVTDHVGEPEMAVEAVAALP